MSNKGIELGLSDREIANINRLVDEGHLEGQKLTTRAQHTPGPWTWEETETGIETSACGPVRARYKRDNNAMRVEAIANARLIAAAPELLEACKTALDNLAPTYSSDHLVMKRLRAAIATAEGTR